MAMDGQPAKAPVSYAWIAPRFSRLSIRKRTNWWRWKFWSPYPVPLHDPTAMIEVDLAALRHAALLRQKLGIRVHSNIEYSTILEAWEEVILFAPSGVVLELVERGAALERERTVAKVLASMREHGEREGGSSLDDVPMHDGKLLSMIGMVRPDIVKVESPRSIAVLRALSDGVTVVVERIEARSRQSRRQRGRGRATRLLLRPLARYSGYQLWCAVGIKHQERRNERDVAKRDICCRFLGKTLALRWRRMCCYRWSLALPLLFASLTTYAACFEEAAARYQVPVVLLQAISKIESPGNPRAINRNRDGSYDIGHMINSRWLPVLSKYGIREADLWDACTNTHVGAGCWRATFAAMDIPGKRLVPTTPPAQTRHRICAQGCAGSQSGVSCDVQLDMDVGREPCYRAGRLRQPNNGGAISPRSSKERETHRAGG